jgi:hypothetical protein
MMSNKSPAEQTRHLHLFLQARAILSAAVRLNLIGPYAAHSELVHQLEPILARLLSDTDGPTTTQTRPLTRPLRDWTDGDDDVGPCTTWPLLEIVAARHDAVHSNAQRHAAPPQFRGCSTAKIALGQPTGEPSRPSGWQRGVDASPRPFLHYRDLCNARKRYSTFSVQRNLRATMREAKTRRVA